MRDRNRRDAPALPTRDGLDPALSRQLRAWRLLVAALAIHVADEALTHFLDFYNPLVLAIRARIGWWPAPTFTFGPWLAGLVAAIVALWLLGPAVRRGATGTRLASYVFGGIMFGNGIAHLAGSVYFGRWLPGATSAPVLLVTGLLLIQQTRTRVRSRRSPAESGAPAGPR